MKRTIIVTSSSKALHHGGAEKAWEFWCRFWFFDYVDFDDLARSRRFPGFLHVPSYPLWLKVGALQFPDPRLSAFIRSRVFPLFPMTRDAELKTALPKLEMRNHTADLRG
jgi:hypothetical protein